MSRLSRSREGQARPNRQGTRSNTHTRRKFTREQWRVYRALQEGPKTSLELVIELGILGVYARVWELRRMGVRIDSRREDYQREDGSASWRNVYTLVEGGCDG